MPVPTRTHRDRDAVWIEAPDAVSAALLMRESVGRLPARLVQCAGSHWRIDVMAHCPAMADVVALVRRWLSLADLGAVDVHEGTRTFVVHRSHEEQRRSAKTGILGRSGSQPVGPAG